MIKKINYDSVVVVDYRPSKCINSLTSCHRDTKTDQSDVVVNRTNIAYLLRQYQNAGLPLPTAHDDDYVNMSGVPSNNLAEEDLDAYKYRINQQVKDLKKKDKSLNEKEKTEKKEKQTPTEQTEIKVKDGE